MNKVILIGRLTRDPEVRYSQSAEPIAITRYTLAVNRQFKRENEPDADFIPCVALAKRGEFAEKYFKKGQQVAVVGRLTIREYDDKGTRKWFTEVVVDDQYFADSKNSNSGGGSASASDSQDDYYVSEAKVQKTPEDYAASAPKKTAKPKPAPKGFSETEDTVDDSELPF